VIRDLSGYVPKVCHDDFNAHALKGLRQHFDCFADERIAVAER
jgi:hypothetical protein